MYSEDTLATISHSGIDLKNWLKGFSHVEEGVRGSVGVIRNHPLLPKGVPVHGMIINSESGELKMVVDGYGNER